MSLPKFEDSVVLDFTISTKGKFCLSGRLAPKLLLVRRRRLCISGYCLREQARREVTISNAECLQESEVCEFQTTTSIVPDF